MRFWQDGPWKLYTRRPFHPRFVLLLPLGLLVLLLIFHYELKQQIRQRNQFSCQFQVPAKESEPGSLEEASEIWPKVSCPFPPDPRQDPQFHEWRARHLQLTLSVNSCQQFRMQQIITRELDRFTRGNISQILQNQAPPEQPTLDRFWMPDVEGMPSALELAQVYQALQLVERDSQGYFSPGHECSAHESLQVLVPYQDRAENLPTFLYHMHSLLRRQRRRYQIILIGAYSAGPLRRGNLVNAFVKASLENGTLAECLAIQDVDKLPVSAHMAYSCGLRPIQLVSRLRSDLTNLTTEMYPGYMGGASLFNRWQFEHVNGFSNGFLGWGGEDDDLAMRLRIAHFPIQHAAAEFWHLTHRQTSLADPQRVQKLTMPTVWRNMRENGLRETHFRLRRSLEHPLFRFYQFVLSSS